MMQRLTKEEVMGKCGIGQGAKCCAYAAADSAGFACAQTDRGLALHIRDRVAAGTMRARVLPLGDYPACQDERARLTEEMEEE